MDANKIEYIKLIKLLCMLQLFAELSKERTPIDTFKDLSFKDVLD